MTRRRKYLPGRGYFAQSEGVPGGRMLSLRLRGCNAGFRSSGECPQQTWKRSSRSAGIAQGCLACRPRPGGASSIAQGNILIVTALVDTARSVPPPASSFPFRVSHARGYRVPCGPAQCNGPGSFGSSRLHGVLCYAPSRAPGEDRDGYSIPQIPQSPKCGL